MTFVRIVSHKNQKRKCIEHLIKGGIMSETPKVGISVIFINDDNEILVGKRKNSHGEGMLSIPGGHVDVGEIQIGRAHV